MKIIIEEEWYADDIINFCFINQIEYEVLSQKVINDIEPYKFLKMISFCSTHIIQKNLKAIGLSYLIPDTYPNLFEAFYKRKIFKMTFQDLKKKEYPYFIKSIDNDKSIDGTIITNQDDLINLGIKEKNCKIYVSEIVNFSVEYRLLIGNNKLYGIGFQKGNKLIDINYEFINQLLKLTKNKFFCIDIGYIIEKKEWAIVEVNPPFALDDYDIPLENYMNFTISFWEMVNEILRK